MPDLLTTAVSGMLSFQRALNVTGHNIANANTPGYSRQIVELAAREGQASGSGFIGSGVDVTTIKRIYDNILADQLRTSISGQSRSQMLAGLAGQIDGLLADSDTGLSPSLQAFFGSVQDLANDPAALSARQTMLGSGEALLQRFRGIDARLRGIGDEVNARLRQSVADINQLSSGIADLNAKIVLEQGKVGQPPNDLMDQRDLLIHQLAEQIGVNTFSQDDGSINVSIGSGQTLVIGTEAREVGVRRNEFDPSQLEFVYKNVSGDTPLNVGNIGGAIGGLLEFRATMLDTARQALGESAVALALEFNAQHASGMDLRGALGGNFFSLNTPDVLPSSGNTGSGTISPIVADIAALDGADHILEFDGVSYSLRRADNGQTIIMTGSGTVPDPFIAVGLSITVAGAPAAGDAFMIRPVSGAPSSLNIAVTDIQSIAMAAPTRTAANSNNIGDATISASEIVDRNDPALLTSSVILFTGPNTYSINGAGAFAYTSGDPIVINGSQFAITGIPQTGDQFNIEANLGGTGDNRNGLLLSEIQSRGILEGGTVGVSDNYARLIADVGGQAHQINANLGAQNVILANIQDSMFSTSGVNLDEEAARLIQYQQAYMAVAQVVAITSTLFDTLIGAVRR